MPVPFGGPNEIPQARELTTGDAFENCIRRHGVVAACEWFDHSSDSAFTRQTIQHLRKRSEENPQ
jgi:hypothetical protein